MAVFAGPKIIDTDLVLYLDAANSRSYPGTGTTWNDLTTNNRNFTFTNTVTFAENSIQFDGIASRAQTANNVTFGNNTTWEAWVNRTASANTFNIYMGRYLPYFGLHSTNRIIFSNRIGGTQQTMYSAGVTITDNTWYHVVCSTEYDGSTNTTMLIHIDGVLRGSLTVAGSQTNTDNYPLTLGTWRPVGDNPLNGRISNVKIYNRTLSSAEILQNFESTRGRYSI